MRAGLTTSVALHAVLLGVGLFSVSAPRAYDVADVESFPVDIVPIENLTESQEGDKLAEVAEQPAPRPTQRPDPVEEAQKIGEAERDMETPPTPDPKPRPVESASEPKAAETTPEQEAESPADEAPAIAAEPSPPPQEESTPEPAPEQKIAENPAEEALDLPSTAPVPEARPQPPRPQTADAREHRPENEPAPRAQPQKQPEENEPLLDQVAALLNREQASGGGAMRSTREEAFGGRETTGERLTQSEMDALRAQIQRCWNVPVGVLDAENLRVSLQFRLDPSGTVEGTPQILSGGVGSSIERAAAESARRAILQCAPYQLPAEKYAAWADVIVHFDPSDMF